MWNSPSSTAVFFCFHLAKLRLVSQGVDGILNGENSNFVANHILVALFSGILDGKIAGVIFAIVRAVLAGSKI